MTGKKEIPWSRITLGYKEDPDFKFAYDQFLEMRSKMKKPVTEYASFLHFKKMQDDCWTKDMAIAALELSITKNYLGIFLPHDYRPKTIPGGNPYN